MNQFKELCEEERNLFFKDKIDTDGAIYCDYCGCPINYVHLLGEYKIDGKVHYDIKTRKFLVLHHSCHLKMHELGNAKNQNENVLLSDNLRQKVEFKEIIEITDLSLELISVVLQALKTKMIKDRKGNKYPIVKLLYGEFERGKIDYILQASRPIKIRFKNPKTGDIDSYIEEHQTENFYVKDYKLTWCLKDDKFE